MKKIQKRRQIVTNNEWLLLFLTAVFVCGVWILREREPKGIYISASADTVETVHTIPEATSTVPETTSTAPETTSTTPETTYPEAIYPEAIYPVPESTYPETVYTAPETVDIVPETVPAQAELPQVSPSQAELPQTQTEPLPSVPTVPNTSQPAQSAQSAQSALININTASAAELTRLPGIGQVLAQRIVDYRESHGAFRTTAELMNVSGIAQGRFSAVADMITTGEG